MLTRLLELLLPNPLWAVLLVPVGVAAGLGLAIYAAHRTVTRPLTMALEAEALTLAAVLAEPRRYPFVSTISPQDFAAGAHERIWAALQKALGDAAVVPADATDAECEALGAQLQARREQILTDLSQHLAAGSAPTTDAARLSALLQMPAANDAQVVTAAEDVLAAGQDRNRAGGLGLVLRTNHPDSADPANPPLRRALIPPSKLRTWTVAALGGLLAGALPAFVGLTGLTGWAAAAAGASLVVLAVSNIVISLVDIDTLYVDVRTWVWGTVGAWVAAVGAAVLAGDPSRLIAGAALVLGCVLVFEVATKIVSTIKKTMAQGFGDTLIIVSTVGVPAALTGVWTMGYYSVMAGFVLAIVGWLVNLARGRAGRNIPFAFGPFLAAGAPAAFLIEAITRAG